MPNPLYSVNPERQLEAASKNIADAAAIIRSLYLSHMNKDCHMDVDLKLRSLNWLERMGFLNKQGRELLSRMNKED